MHANALTTLDVLRGFSHVHTGRQAKLCLQRGTALICRVVIALTHCPIQWSCSIPAPLVIEDDSAIVRWGASSSPT